MKIKMIALMMVLGFGLNACGNINEGANENCQVIEDCVKDFFDQICAVMPQFCKGGHK